MSSARGGNGGNNNNGKSHGNNDYKLSEEYKAIADVPVTISIDPSIFSNISNHSINVAAKEGKQSPDEIFSYNDVLENRIVEKYEKKLLQQSTIVSPTISKKSLSPPPPNVSSKSPSFSTAYPSSIIVPPVHETIDKANRAVDKVLFGGDKNDALTTSRTQQQTIASGKSGEEVALLYLPDETPARQAQLSQIWMQTRSLSTPPNDIEVLKAYFTFDGNVQQSVQHLSSYIALKELGFPDDDISKALFQFNNNQEEALEYLIRGDVSK